MRGPRRRFAASFVVTLAALPACGRTVDHRDPVTPTQPTTGDTSPRDHRDAPTSWVVVVAADGSCTAQADGAAAPSKIACPPDAQPGAKLQVQKEPDGTCMVMPPMMDCPEGMSCNPPPPQHVECPPP